MPIFDLKCSSCGETQDNVLLRVERLPLCPQCGARTKKRFTLGRRINAEPHSFFSRSMGINPDQIPEEKAKYPDRVYNADGDLLVRNYQHQKQLAKEIGMSIG